MTCAVEHGADPSCCYCRGHGDLMIRAEYPDKPLGGCFPCPLCFPELVIRGTCGVIEYKTGPFHSGKSQW